MRGDLAGIELINLLRNCREEKGYGQDEVLLKPVDTCGCPVLFTPPPSMGDNSKIISKGT